MGWEDLPPEVPTWKHMPATAEALALVISHEGHIAKLEERVRELEAANDDFRNRLKPSYDYMDGQAVSVAEDEIDRLRAALQGIIDFGDAEYKVMYAKQALEVK